MLEINSNLLKRKPEGWSVLLVRGKLSLFSLLSFYLRPIHYGTLVPFILSIMWKKLSFCSLKKCLVLMIFFIGICRRNNQVICLINNHIENNGNFKKNTLDILFTLDQTKLFWLPLWIGHKCRWTSVFLINNIICKVIVSISETRVKVRQWEKYSSREVKVI